MPVCLVSSFSLWYSNAPPLIGRALVLADLDRATSLSHSSVPNLSESWRRACHQGEDVPQFFV